MENLATLWYTLSFFALVMIFILVACYEAHCATRNTIYDRRRRRRINEIHLPIPIKPISPSPSYSQFAPPSYDTVIRKTEIFIISESCINCSSSSTPYTSSSLRSTALIHDSFKKVNQKTKLNDIEWNGNKT